MNKEAKYTKLLIRTLKKIVCIWNKEMFMTVLQSAEFSLILWLFYFFIFSCGTVKKRSHDGSIFVKAVWFCFRITEENYIVMFLQIFFPVCARRLRVVFFHLRY